ncbi:MAG: glycosyltransferase family 4 protein [Anaerolineae bacterium]|nr:glycosyltransferase family 4 protein [Anaerolineae bacterium]
MHIVFISWWWPYPANNGSKIRIYNLLRHLAKNHQVTLLSFAEPDEATPEQIAHLREFCARVEAVPKPTYNPTATKAVLGYLSRWPRSLVDVYSLTMASLLEKIVDEETVDLIIASEFQTIRYLEIAPEIPAILDQIEITSFYDRVKAASGTSGRLRAQLTVTKLESALKNLLVRGVAFSVVSEHEQALMRRFSPPNGRIEVVPNGVDTVANQPNPAIQPQPDTIIYSGAVTYFANLDAAQFFIREVFPLIRQQKPGATFTVTGGTGNVDVSDLKAQPGVVFSGYLPLVAPAIQASWVNVVPLRLGSGTRLKILESMALGVPLVSTTKGAEGLHVHPGEDILIADTPQAMADTILSLFSDADLRARLVRNGRTMVEQSYDWGVIAAQLMTLIDELAKQ